MPVNMPLSATRFIQKFALAVAVGASIFAAASAQTDGGGTSSEFTITGRLTEAEGKPRNVNSAAVFVTDAATGYPLLTESRKPLGADNGIAGPDGWLHTMTNSHGEFALKNIPPGTYRLVAQSWLGHDSVPTTDDNDSVLMLHGDSEAVVVRDSDVTDVHITPAGNAVLSIQATPDEGNAYLFIGTESPRAEPIMGPMFWGDDFVRSVIGVTHIKRGHQVIQGLPLKQDVHVMLLNYDNNAGVGGVSVHMDAVTHAELPIYATWSNGYFLPPDRLRPLVEWIRNHKSEFAGLLTDGNPAVIQSSRGSRDFQRFLNWLIAHADETRKVADLGEFGVLDIVAAESHLRILEYHESRQQARQAIDQQPEPDATDDIPE